MTREPALRCYACGRPAVPNDDLCRACGFTLDWSAIADLRSLDYLRLRLEQWRRLEVVDDVLADRLVAEVAQNHATLLRSLAEGGAAVRRRVPIPAAPPPPPARRPAGLRPRYTLTLGPATTIAPPKPSPPTVLPAPPPFLGAEPRRPLLDRLVELGTVRTMLYTGAILFAVSVIIFLRNQLREQLHRPEVQAGLLGLLTTAALAGGVALVVRARERAEQRLIGRGVLLLGTILLPVNPWLWLRTGLVEDRGNAWLVSLAMFGVTIAIALGLGDRVFVFLAYASALATAWLLAFKPTGGTAPGIYGLALAVVSSLFLLAELPLSRATERRGSTAVAPAFFLCGHLGVGATLVLYTSVVRFVPVEILAALRYFDATGYSEWTACVMALLAANVYVYSAWRRADARFAYLGVAAATLALALALAAWDAPPGAWLTACGAAAFACSLAGRALRADTLFASPLRSAARAFAWIGTVAATGVAFALALGMELRWFTCVGIVLLAATFALEAWETRRSVEAVPITGLVLLLAAALLRAAGVEWIFADAVLAVLVGLIPFAIAVLPEDRAGTRDGLAGASWILAVLLAILALAFAVEASPSLAHRPIALAIALAAAFASNAWTAPDRACRLALAAAAAVFVEVAALLAVASVSFRFDLQERTAAFLLAPVGFAALAGWAVTRARDDLRLRDAAIALRGLTLGAVAVATFCANTLLVDTVFDRRGAFLLAAAMTLLAIAPLAVAAVERVTPFSFVEGTFGLLLGLAAWCGLAIGIGDSAPTAYDLFAASIVAGLAPLVLSGVDVALARRIPAVAQPASVLGGGLAVLLAASLTLTLSSGFDAPTTSTPDRLAFVALASLVTAAGAWASARSEHPFARAAWTLHTFVAAGLGAHAGMHAAPQVPPAAIGWAAAGGLVVVFAVRPPAMLERLRPAMLAIGHASIAAAVVDALRVQRHPMPVSWTFVAVVATCAAAYLSGGAASPRGSASERVHRGLGSLGSLGTAVAALHALGFTTVAAQAEPLGLLLTVAIAAVVLAPAEWAGRDGLVLAHVTMAGLLVAIVLALETGEPWTAAKLARFALVVAGFYGVAAMRRSGRALAGAIAAVCVSVFALGQHVHAPMPTRVIAFASIAAGFAILSARLPEPLAWARATLANACHAIFVLAAGIAVATVLPVLALGNVALGRHVAALASLTAAAWIARIAIPAAADVYGFARSALALATYGLLGVRLGYHPWRDSAFYTLPVGAVLVALGARRTRSGEREGGGLLLSLGALLVGLPPLLHALENRFVLDVSPVGYDVTTLSAGLALGLVGVLFRLRVPSVVGAAVLAIDLAVVVFGHVAWNQVTLSVFAAIVGAVMMLGSWFILYRRDDLYRARDAVATRFEAFRQWR